MEQISKALVSLRTSLKNPKKSSKGYNWKYADLVQVTDSINESLIENKLTVLQFPISQMIDGKNLVGVKTIVLHESGEQIENSFSTVLTDLDPKAVGGFITYYRRYALLAIFGLAPEEEITGEINPEKNNNKVQANKGISDKQLDILRKNADKLTSDEINALANKTMTPAEASSIIGRVLGGKK